MLQKTKVHEQIMQVSGNNVKTFLATLSNFKYVIKISQRKQQQPKQFIHIITKLILQQKIKLNEILSDKKLENKQTAVYLYINQSVPDQTSSYNRDNCQCLYDSHITAVLVVFSGLFHFYWIQGKLVPNPSSIASI